MADKVTSPAPFTQGEQLVSLGLDCLPTGEVVGVLLDDKGLFVPCSYGNHYLHEHSGKDFRRAVEPSAPVPTAAVEDLSADQLRDEVRYWRANAAATLESLIALAGSLRKQDQHDFAGVIDTLVLNPQRAALTEALEGRTAEAYCDEGCGLRILNGHWVYQLTDGGEIHCNCADPTVLPSPDQVPDDDPTAYQHQDYYDPAEVERALASATVHLAGQERACRICGCTQGRACETPEGPCAWVEEDLCSAPACVAAAAAEKEPA